MTKTADKRPKGPFSAATDALLSPSRAAENAARPGSAVPAAWIYAAFLLVSAVFYAAKPFDFPDRNAAFPRQAQGLWFWLRVMAWQPPLEAAWIVFLLGLLEWFREGKLFWRLLGGVAATAFPFIALVVHQNGGMGRAGYAACAAGWLLLMALGMRRSPRAAWLPTASLMLALNAIGLAAVPAMALAVGLDADGLYKGAQVASGLWMLLCAALSLRALSGLRMPRCFMAVLLSMFMQIAFAFTLHMLGLVPKEILKALLYA
jgi:hypothetical protein